jgi:uncharacterized protein
VSLSLWAWFILASQATFPAPPPEIAGTWDVEQVAVDAQDQLHWGTKPNDPQLMGRTLVIEAGHVQFDDGKRIGCKPGDWRHRATTWAVLIGKGFPRPAMGGRSATPTLQDFGLQKEKNEKVTTYALCPGKGGKAGPSPTDAWVAMASSDRLAFHHDNQVLLLLKRRPKDAQPTPSFDCAKSVSPTEKAICGNFDLASWDRSVALAFQQALERQPPEKKTSLRRTQDAWLKERDACGAKQECIDEQQWRRVEALVQE